MSITPPQRSDTQVGLGSARVISFESRRAREMADLIRRHGGTPIVAPSMREVPLERESAAFELKSRLECGEVDVVIVLTGVGLRTLVRALESSCPAEHLADLLARTTLVVRGPKPVAELKKLNLTPQIRVPEPNTWRELLEAIDRESPVQGRRAAVIEYGARNEELIAALTDRQADVLSVPVYRWALPEDTGPLRDAVSKFARGEADFVLFTSATQVDHVMQIASDMGLTDAVRAAASRVTVASIGPVCSEALGRHGLPVRLEPEHPKMGHLVVAVSRFGAAGSK